MSVTRERIRQIEVVALKKLKESHVKAMLAEIQ
jgi:DNA-directed RNA polymerase sigma subunit (sigma70/sigma32)